MRYRGAVVVTTEMARAQGTTWSQLLSAAKGHVWAAERLNKQLTNGSVGFGERRRRLSVKEQAEMRADVNYHLDVHRGLLGVIKELREPIRSAAA